MQHKQLGHFFGISKIDRDSEAITPQTKKHSCFGHLICGGKANGKERKKNYLIKTTKKKEFKWAYVFGIKNA